MASSANYAFVADPLKFQRILWPDRYLYSAQREWVYSFVENDRTVIGACNGSGKDYAAGFLHPYFFLTRGSDPKTGIPYPCRIVNTSAKDDHLRVLWGEINSWIQSAKYPLDSKKGGPLIINDKEIRRVYQSGPLKGERCPLSYMIGMVASDDTIAAMQGHHVAKTGDRIPRTAFFADECSSVKDEFEKMAAAWANRMFLFGNTWPCHNFFKRALEGDAATGDPGGDLLRDPERPERGYFRKTFRVTVEDSPNVRLARAQVAAGQEPTGEIIVPGVKDWEDLQRDLKLMNPVQQEVSLYARFWKGKDAFMFPEAWLANAVIVAKQLRATMTDSKRPVEAVGLDPGEGIANTVWTSGDKKGIVKQVSIKTPEPMEIVKRTIAYIHEWGVPPEKVAIDRGGGGLQIASFLRDAGYNVTTVAFGEAPSADPKTRNTMLSERVEQKEERYAYTNRRAEMYWIFRSLVDPDRPEGVYGIPPECSELIRQLSPLPLQYDKHGRMKMLPKNRGRGMEIDQTTGKKELTHEDLIGCSPDEADSAILMTYSLMKKRVTAVAGAV